MSETSAIQLSDKDITLTAPAHTKMSELVQQVEEDIKGIRVYAAPGGCSGMSFGMTFTDQINDNDGLLECDGFNVIVDMATLQHMRGVEIDFADQGGAPSFVFNNLQPVSPEGGSACGGCSSSSQQGGGCS
ncbi:MAG: iron-sulfur cluster assembly accessory protein [Gammaproteobacteria bacterium]|nr:iron-sulfur cluster assembly accessory protein [Gammaproteobacteria bacterium]